jgi:hypothetical protein
LAIHQKRRNRKLSVWFERQRAQCCGAWTFNTEQLEKTEQGQIGTIEDLELHAREVGFQYIGKYVRKSNYIFNCS